MNWLPLPQRAVAIAIWTSVYVATIFVNFFKTGEWPYEVLVKNGLNPVKWATFIAVQVSLIMVFDQMLRGVRYLTPRQW